MSESTGIEWTDSTWNPVRGCTKISAGCKFCYAESFAERWRGIPGHPYEQGFDLRLVPEKLTDPLKWRRSRKVFVNSMSDLFHESVDDKYIEQVFRVMIAANWHVFQVLTKRPERMKEFITRKFPSLNKQRHIWLGVSVENRDQGVPRIRQLRETPAALRFLSIEPLLEDIGSIPLKGIKWVIVGGESGRNPRPMKAEWVESLRCQCEARDVPFFFKQWGGRNKKTAGRLLNGIVYDGFPSKVISKISQPPSKNELSLLINTIEKELGVELLA